MDIEGGMLGFEFSSVNYPVEEIFNTSRGIIKQVYKEDSGEYFTIILIKS